MPDKHHSWKPKNCLRLQQNCNEMQDMKKIERCFIRKFIYMTFLPTHHCLHLLKRIRNYQQGAAEEALIISQLS